MHKLENQTNLMGVDPEAERLEPARSDIQKIPTSGGR